MNKLWDTWSTDERDIFKTWLRDMLKMGGVQITFTKKDGSQRVMNATLEPDKIPEYENVTGRQKTPNEDVISVVDSDINEWRSIRFDSINQIRISLV